MSAICQVTGAKPGFGHRVSWSKQKTRRRFSPNVQRRTWFVPSLGRKVTLTVSTKAIKIIDRRGIDSVIAELRARGEKF